MPWTTSVGGDFAGPRRSACSCGLPLRSRAWRSSKQREGVMGIRDRDELLDGECESCPLGAMVERREFLRDAVARTLLAIGALSALSGRASALSVAFTNGTGVRTDKAYPLPNADGVLIDK